MMLYQKNFHFLHTLGFAECMLKPQETSSVNIYTGKKGYLTGVKQAEGREILLHSAYDPLNEALRLIAGKEFSKQGSIFVLGLGLGYHLGELVNQTSSELLIFVLETDWDIIRAAMQVIDFERILASGRVVLVFGNLSEIRSILNDVFSIEDSLLKLLKIDFLDFPSKLNSAVEEVQTMHRIVREVLNSHYLAMNDEINWMLRRLKNTIKHVPYLARAPYPSQFANAWSKPVVIVLAGPSLSKNIDVLKEWQDRVTIFCVNTVFNRLLDYGIIPDAAFSIDIHSDLAEKHYKRNEPIPKSIVFVANPGVDPRCADLFGKHLLIFGGGGYFQHELAQDMGSEALPAGLSVTHFAFIVARHLGASPIILIGQDLAYGQEGQTHSRGCIYDEQNTMLSQNDDVLFLEGYEGGEVSSCQTWKLFRDWYEEFLENNFSLVINATEGGAKIKGTRQLALKDALKQYVGLEAEKKVSFGDWLNSVKLGVSDNDMIKKIRNSFELRLNKLRVAESICKQGVRLYNTIENPQIPLELKNRHLLEMEEEVKNIMKDRWIFYTFRSEFIRGMSAYYNMDTDSEKEPPEVDILRKAKSLHDLFENLRSYLIEFAAVIENHLDH
ncbi:hypothetical protein Desaci_3836 [Desulfosporosinus acidiphilus SJ4]|uniref:DUF115 domain-containing protein n=1 Tax=Desulfosporosinus acidiphilus (strain DSM 22704 / JCM 16185 / SJ4) TaxID=646529 RepID=I4DA93_DESAJ|nr:6-hydroxymethylpterin diphosphokinase MptE-like protein [Desulfosporosinus acidiphilus]AFM42717.1 hypothetical protein Desaci_3836 [Desulfosporosinus acidiphilus SJ4]